MKFHIPIPPPTATSQGKGLFVCKGRARFYTKPEFRDLQMLWTAEFRKYAPAKRFDGAVFLDLCMVFPHLQGSKDKTARIYKTTKPDTDNAAKMLIDAMTKAGFWHDDAQVAVENLSKFYGADVGVHIETYPLCEQQSVLSI